MERELHRQGVELASRAAKLERLNGELQEFAFVASHDMQEPLRKIQAFGNLLITRFGESLESDAKDYLQRMMNAADRMSALLTALLNYSRIATRANPFEPIDLGKIARDTVADLEHLIGVSSGRVEIGPMVTVDADPVQMGQLFQNLIINSLKYRQECNNPVIRLHAVSQDKTCQIFVEDNGIGFEEKHRDRIFKPLQRLHGRDVEGYGMGLAICRKIVERHGGSITARSTPGQGATFIITLPLRHPHASGA